MTKVTNCSRALLFLPSCSVSVAALDARGRGWWQTLQQGCAGGCWLALKGSQGGFAGSPTCMDSPFHTHGFPSPGSCLPEPSTEEHSGVLAGVSALLTGWFSQFWGVPDMGGVMGAGQCGSTPGLGQSWGSQSCCQHSQRLP